jgi:hypothetical protein
MVTLFALRQCPDGGETSHRFLPLGGQGWSHELLPELESVPHLLTIRGCGHPMAVRAEVLGGETIGREEPLGLDRGLEPLPAALPLAGGLVRVLCAIVEIPGLLMFPPGDHLRRGSAIALQLVGGAHAWDVGQPFEQLAKELLGRFLVPPPLDQDIQDIALLIDRPPEIMMLVLG